MVSRWIRLAAVGTTLAAGCWIAASVEPVGLAAAAPRPRVSVLRSARLGGYAEDMAYVSSGPYRGMIALSIGSEVLGVKADALGSGKPLKPVKLFDYRAAGPRYRPTGIVFVPPMNRFVATYSPSSANDGRFGRTDVLSLFDAGGRLEQWPLLVAEGLGPIGRPEGLEYVPIDAPAFPQELRGRLLMVGTPDGETPNNLLNVVDIGRGIFTVVKQLPVASDPDVMFGDVAALPSGDLMLTRYGDSNLFRLDPSMGAQSVETSGLPGTVGETLIALPDGRLAAASSYPANVLRLSLSGTDHWTTDSTARLPLGLDREPFGGLAWDSARDRFLLGERLGSVFEYESRVVAVAPALDRAELLRTMWVTPAEDYRARLNVGLTYDPDADSAVMARSGRRLEDYREWEQVFAVEPALVAGSLASLSSPPGFTSLLSGIATISGGFKLPMYNPAASNGPAAIAHLADQSRHAILMRRAEGRTIYFLNEDGTAVVDESGAAIGLPMTVNCPVGRGFVASQLAALSPAGGGVRYAVVGECRAPVPAVPSDWGPPLVVLLNESGAEVARLDPFDAFGMVRPAHVTFVTTGRYAGALALVNDDSLVVFRMR